MPLEVTGDVTLDCDVVVVGSGAGGGTAAAVLAQAGLDVVIVEAGRYFSEADFDGAELSGFDRLYLNGGGMASADGSVGLLAAQALGGTTLVNYTYSFRTPDGVRREWAEEHGLEAVASEGIPGVVRRRIVNLRFAGQDEALSIEGEPFEEAFAAAYREIYGYAPEGRAIEVESIRVVASSAEEEVSTEAVALAGGTSGTRRCWMAGAWSEVPVYDRAHLAPGNAFPGPALVFESHSATLVASGWQGRVDGAGNLVLSISGGIDSP